MIFCTEPRYYMFDEEGVSVYYGFKKCRRIRWRTVTSIGMGDDVFFSNSVVWPKVFILRCPSVPGRYHADGTCRIVITEKTEALMKIYCPKPLPVSGES